MDKTLYLDPELKVWHVGKIDLPVIEDVPMSELQWFRDKTKEIESQKENKTLTLLKGLEYDEEWWEKTCQVGLGKTMKEVQATGISEPKFRALMAEVFYFLQNFGTIEEAKQSGLYDQKTQTKENKRS